MSDGAGAAFGATFFLLYFALIAIILVSWWKIFTKADKPGWAGIVPIYNVIVLMDIIGRPGWWFVLLMIPFVNFIFLFIVSIDLAKSFGKGTGYGVAMVFLPIIMYPLLAFGDAEYHGPAAADTGTASAAA